jgi:hypothetical protein
LLEGDSPKRRKNDLATAHALRVRDSFQRPEQTWNLRYFPRRTDLIEPHLAVLIKTVGWRSQ